CKNFGRRNFHAREAVRKHRALARFCRLENFVILVAPDKFKGSLTAREAAAAIARGILQAKPDALIVQTPIADGGEGFAEILAQKWTTTFVRDPLGRLIRARCGWLDEA